jgi:cell shape-determining protein MreC
MFPPGLPMGTILDFRLPEASEFFEVAVAFAADFRELRYVEVIHSGPQAQAEQMLEQIP